MKSVLYFSAEWCGPCKAFYPVVQEVCATANVYLDKIDVDHNKQMAELYKITGVPTIIIVEGGTLVHRQTGAMPKQLLQQILTR
jgi:thioredoxin 1